MLVNDIPGTDLLFGLAAVREDPVATGRARHSGFQAGRYRHAAVRVLPAFLRDGADRFVAEVESVVMLPVREIRPGSESGRDPNHSRRFVSSPHQKHPNSDADISHQPDVVFDRLVQHGRGGAGV